MLQHPFPRPLKVRVRWQDTSPRRRSCESSATHRQRFSLQQALILLLGDEGGDGNVSFDHRSHPILSRVVEPWRSLSFR